MAKGSCFRVLCFVCLLFTSSAFSLPGRAGTSPPSKPDYSKELAVIDDFHLSVQMENDGTMTRETKVRVHVQSDAGVRAYGLLSFGYSSANERLTIESIKVLKPDGAVIVTPAENVEDVTPAITRAAPMYSDYREKHVVVKGLDAGDEIEYATRTQMVKPLIPGEFWLNFDFVKSEIALHEVLEVSVPKNRKIIIHSPSLKPVITENGDRRVYTWTTANLKDQTPPDVAEGRAPPSAVEITSFENWQQVGKWWGQLEKQQAQPTAAVRAEALALTKNATTNEQKVAAIYKYVSEQFRYISISFGIGRYKPHASAEVLSNQYGDCKDKHTLLSALLQAVGIKVYPALISASNKLDPGVPSPGQFDHVISYVPLGQKALWLDTTAEVAPEGLLMPNLLDKQALVIPDNRPAFLAKTPSVPPFQSFIKFDAEGKLTSDGTFTGKIERTARGYAGVLLRLVFRNASQNQWQEVAQDISRLMSFGGTVSNVSVSSPDDIAHPFQYSYTYVRKNYGDWADHKILPALPPFGMPEAKKGKDQAGKPVYFSGPVNFMFTSKIELPKGFVPELPKPLDLKFDFADYHAAYAFKDGVLTVERDLSVKVREVPAAHCDDYLKLQKAVTADEEQFITLNTGSGAPFHVVDPQALNLYRQAVQALQMQDPNGAEDFIQKALALDPKFEKAWTLQAFLQLTRGEREEAIEDLRKSTALDPSDPVPYTVLAHQLTFEGKRKEAVQVWRDLLKHDPNQTNAHVQLGMLLLAEKQYSEAAPELEAAVAAGKGSPKLLVSLAQAYTGMGDAAKAADAFKKAAAADPTARIWEAAADSLAKFNPTLAEAQHYAELAVKADEAQSAKLDIKTAGPADIRLMVSLAASWGSLGGIDLKENHLALAEKYLQAAWDLSQESDFADRLGQVYEKLGNREAAVRMYAEAVKADASRNSDARSRLSRLLGNRAFRIKAAETKADLEMPRAWRAELGRISKATGSADFLVLFSPGPKVEGWKYVDGDPHFKTLGRAIGRARFQLVFPDSTPTRILRRGAVVCVGAAFGCDFTLEPLDMNP